MGQVRKPHPVMPIVGLLYADAAMVERVLPGLRAMLGAECAVSEEWAFDQTVHYEAEMGAGLLRRFYTFERLADPGPLADWKLQTNAMELEFAGGHGRTVNIDPGYLTGSTLVLASVRSLGHRVYIGGGIFAEATMTYRQGEWIKRDYTFPDFRTGRYDEFFSAARARYLALLGTLEPH